MCGRCTYCLSGQPALCENGALANGAGTLLGGAIRLHRSGGDHVHHHLGVSAFAERAVVAAASCVRIDAGVPFEKAALFGCALMTGVGAVLNTARVEAGSSVAVFGLGGVGLSAVMGAVLAGAYPIIAVDRIPAKLALAERLGATHALLASDGGVAAIRDIAKGGVDCAFEAVGHAGVMAEAYAATRRGGKTVAIGLPHPDQKLSIPAVSIVAEGRQILGSYMGSAVPVRDVPRLIALYQAGKLPVGLLQSGTLALDELNDAFDALASGETVRQVLVPA
jgi:alcohol dehydrogenase